MCSFNLKGEVKLWSLQVLQLHSVQEYLQSCSECLSCWPDFPFFNLVFYLYFHMYKVLIFLFLFLFFSDAKQCNLWCPDYLTNKPQTVQHNYVQKKAVINISLGFRSAKEGFFLLHLVSGFRTHSLHPGITGMGPRFSCCLSSLQPHIISSFYPWCQVFWQWKH